MSKITNALGRIDIFPNLARGLSYYTGAIFEIVLNEGDFTGSLGGGGRYDGLIGMFGKEQIPAVGFSLGLERILLIMEERGMFPAELQTNSADVMVTIWNEETVSESLKLAAELRARRLARARLSRSRQTRQTIQIRRFDQHSICLRSRRRGIKAKQSYA